MTARICPPSTELPAAIGATLSTTPAQGAPMELSIFIADTTNSVWPVFTVSPARTLMSTTAPACGLSTA